VVEYGWKQTGGVRLNTAPQENGRLDVSGITQPGEYEFTLTVADALGQTDDDTVRVNVKGA